MTSKTPWLCLAALVICATLSQALVGAVDGPPARYVDAAVAHSGDGLSWATAWKTISEAAGADLPPGTVVHIRPGTYYEDVAISSSGEEVIALKTGVSVSGDQVTFPPGTDLSSIDLTTHPGEYYVYVARSLLGNHGVFPITAVDEGARAVTVSAAAFRSESGVPSDPARLSAAVGRPVIYRNAGGDPLTERVVLDASQDDDICTVLYIGGYIDPYHATAADFNILDGLDVTGAQEEGCGGIHLQNSSFNVIQNGRIYDHQGVGILLAGSTIPARYNYVLNNQVWNTPYEAVYIGAGDDGPEYNHTYYNHIIGNELFVQGAAANARLENAVDIKEYNEGNVVADNLIRDFDLVSQGNGALDIRDGAHQTLVYGNTFRDIGCVASGDTYYVINVYPEVSHVWLYNNLVYRTAPESDNVYALNVHADQTEDVLLAHNTVYGMDAGLLIQYSTPGGDGSGNGVTIANNLFSQITGTLLEEWMWDGAVEGTFDLHHNVFPRDPGSYSVPPAFIGEASFLDPSDGHFQPLSGSLGVDQGVALSPTIPLDLDYFSRDVVPDVGAFEYRTPTAFIYLPFILRNYVLPNLALDQDHLSFLAQLQM